MVDSLVIGDVNATRWIDSDDSFFGKDIHGETPQIIMTNNCIPITVYFLTYETKSIDINNYFNFSPDVPQNIFDLPDACKQNTPQKVIINKKRTIIAN